MVDGYEAIKAAVSVPPSGTPSTISFPMCLILSYRVSSTAIFVVPHICCCHHPPPTPSSHIYNSVIIVLPIYHISSTPSLHRHLRWHTYPPPLSYSVSASAVLVNLCLPCSYHLPPYPQYPISASIILIVLYLCRFYDVPIDPLLCRCCSLFLHPCSIPTSRSSYTTQPRLSGAAFRSVRCLCSYRGGVVVVPVRQQTAIFSGRRSSSLGARDTRNHVCSVSGVPYYIYG